MILRRGRRSTSTWTTRWEPRRLLFTVIGPCARPEGRLEVVQAVLSRPPLPLHRQGEEKQLSEKSLHPPASPATLPDHLKCNILKAQMEAAFRVRGASTPTSDIQREGLCTLRK